MTKPSAPSTPDPAVAVCFWVKVDGRDLGAFTACDGIGCEVVIEQREEGGNNSFVHQLPGRIKYTNIKLTRPVDADTKKIAVWFAGFGGVVQRTTATIQAMTADGTIVYAWHLTGVIPVRWTGPSLSVDSAKVATETLELAHHGFMQGAGA
ncbi:phage tail protein [Catellatospora sp. TT07R-123]|uniref:phage tail protein n=1 Tax=Catellatospora sp. TT07R-123 TaxID=2733863 RepID=UPI001B28DF38|nr:phage tail protein [Catellatospora sp. TT07R-123]GHJ45267.1 phage tail protein [Catellatospora sp. TT07R-123]